MKGLVIARGPSFKATHLDYYGRTGWLDQFDYILTIHDHRGLDERGVDHFVFNLDYTPNEAEWIRAGNKTLHGIPRPDKEHPIMKLFNGMIQNKNLRTTYPHYDGVTSKILNDSLIQVPVESTSAGFSGIGAIDVLLKHGVTEVHTLGIDFNRKYLGEDDGWNGITNWHKLVEDPIAALKRKYRFSLHACDGANEEWNQLCILTQAANTLICTMELRTETLNPEYTADDDPIEYDRGSKRVKTVRNTPHDALHLSFIDVFDFYTNDQHHSLEKREELVMRLLHDPVPLTPLDIKNAARLQLRHHFITAVAEFCAEHGPMWIDRVVVRCGEVPMEIVNTFVQLFIENPLATVVTDPEHVVAVFHPHTTFYSEGNDTENVLIQPIGKLHEGAGIWTL